MGWKGNRDVTAAHLYSTVCPRKNGPPKYNGVVFEILGRHH